MKILLTLLLSALLISGCSDPEIYNINGEIDDTFFKGKTDWIRAFGGSGTDTGQAIIHTSDGGYAILGYTDSTDGDLLGKTTAVNDYWLLKLDENGEKLWSKTYGGSKDDRGQSLIETHDGGYAITGYAMSDDGDASVNKGFHDNWIIRLDGAGNILWEKSFGFSGHDHSYDLVQSPDGGFFFVGFLDITSARADGNLEKGSFLTRHGVGEFWGTKIDADGNLEWRNYFGGSNNDRAHAVVAADDGGYVLAGFTESDDFDIANSRGSYDFWVLKIDAAGKLLWERSFGGEGIDIAHDIAKTKAGTYLVTGNTFSADQDVSQAIGESDLWLIHLDDDGELLWENTYGGLNFDAGQSVMESKTGGIILCGNSKSSGGDLDGNMGENDIWILKTDAKGQLLWQETFGGRGIDLGFDATENAEKSIILVGETSSADFVMAHPEGMSDLVVIKIR